jgi:hypothetical protein
MSVNYTLRACENLAELLDAHIKSAPERGYYLLKWPSKHGKRRIPPYPQKPLQILARLLSVAVAPAAAGGGGLTPAEAGELAELRDEAPSFVHCSGWEQQIIEAALPTPLRDALRNAQRRRKAAA